MNCEACSRHKKVCPGQGGEDFEPHKWEHLFEPEIKMPDYALCAI